LQNSAGRRSGERAREPGGPPGILRPVGGPAVECRGEPAAAGAPRLTRRALRASDAKKGRRRPAMEKSLRQQGAEARSAGQVRFKTDRPCPSCRGLWRYASDGSCVVCRKLNLSAWRARTAIKFIPEPADDKVA